nr:immunoglobulin heavy chain junction region [Mus musculus]
CARDHYAMDYW